MFSMVWDLIYNCYYDLISEVPGRLTLKVIFF